MKITGTQTIESHVDISEHKLVECTIDLMESKFGLKDRWIQDGWVCENERDWRHGSVGTDKIRIASNKDVENFELLQKLRLFRDTL